MTREEALRLAGKLAQFTEEAGATQAEAENAAERLGKILRENNLSMGDVTAAQMEEDIERKDMESGFKRPPVWAQYLAQGIGVACDCTMMTCSRGFRKTDDGRIEEVQHRFSYVGHSADVAVASYFLEYLLRLLPDMAKAAQPERRWDWLYGAAMAIVTRLRNTIHPVSESTQRGLILVKEQAVKNWLAVHVPNLSYGKGIKQPARSDDLINGYRTGQEVPLQDAIAHSSSNLKRIG